MVAVALVLYLVFAAAAFGWRTWWQWHRTGSTGFHGIAGRPGSLEWLAGVGLVVVLVLSLAAPILQLADVVAPIPLLDKPIVQWIGLAVALAGVAGTLYAQHAMGESWRIGVDATERTTLVRSGVFGMVRNPIYTGMFTFAAGVTLMAPNPVAVVGFLLLIGVIELQVRVVEEPYLCDVHGDRYRSYTAEVGRFVPAVGRRSRAPHVG
ncbi:methyltransferase family protein [Nocardia sp. NPDC050175]|uniref:methyltransferase family protein n=1 Tax=Nocardia sp. NPDC050175 TaxID=3364317 RepID=UPI0037A84D08